ncbi:DUF3626 domain-containing protein [Occultella glacieicola]|uniref:DUF3626 domain-containing protein n=1 Tax=Occultella glacieicola TaxID=2518684 RepID=A0ABY2E7U7_9MICO|nr:DUF3626 domain-containing protein [Occultella glacieicola]
MTLQFHPDRRVADRSILAAMADDGRYRSQFETGTSNGGLTAHPGGDRWGWESRLFGGAYDGAPSAQRPVYGALNHRRRAVGGAQRFGSAHFRLTAEVNARSTFCYPDSVLKPVDFGVASRMPLIAIADADSADLLDDGIEAHVHGPVRLPVDVEALVLDPCFRGTAVEADAAALGCALEWHPGFRITTHELTAHPTYRGQRFVDLGLRLAVDGVLDAAMIGAAARSGDHDEQDLKRVWHLLARFGQR